MCLYDDWLRAGAPGASADQGSLLGENLSPAPVAVVVVVQAAQRNLLASLEAGEIFYEIIDHTNVFTVQIWLEEISLLVLEMTVS